MLGPKSSIRPPRPQFNMMLHTSQLESTKGVDELYDQALQDFFMPYHILVDLLCRVAVNHQTLNEPLINLSKSNIVMLSLQNKNLFRLREFDN